MANGLCPNVPADRATLAANGYSSLENYLNGLVAATVQATTSAAAQTGWLQVLPAPVRTGQALILAHPLQVGAGGSFGSYSFEARLVAHGAIALTLPGLHQGPEQAAGAVQTQAEQVAKAFFN